ncbi:hypothetical protein MMC25_007874 [Agyrium rufum]|nr:hypothetical protein [Agyrium rufum]
MSKVTGSNSLPSPSPSNVEELQFNLAPLAQYNARQPPIPDIAWSQHNRQYQPSPTIHQNPPAVSNYWYIDNVRHYPDQLHGHQPNEMNMRQDLYGSSILETQYMPYGSPHMGLQAFNNRHLEAGPLTPATSELGTQEQRRTRSGRIVVHSIPRNRKGGEEEEKTPKKRKKAKTRKGTKADVPHISAPLSELTKNLHHVVVRDMEAWVNRSVQTRKAEVAKKNGHIARPMNSFMLYRSAYAERTKLWCLQNNHQIVSSVSGESWPLEPPEVREKYNEYARIERDNHAKAHPEYKFSPSKSQKDLRRRRDQSEEPGDTESPFNDGDSEWRPSKNAKKTPQIRTAQNPSQLYDFSDQDNQFVSPYLQTPYHGVNLNRSAYEYSNPGMIPPPPLTEFDHSSHYYQTTVHSSTFGEGIEDVRIHRTAIPDPGTQSMPAPPIVSLPGGQHYELLEGNDFPGFQDFDDVQVDPSLLAYDGHYPEQSQGQGANSLFEDYHIGGPLNDVAGNPADSHSNQFDLATHDWPQTDPGSTSKENEFSKAMDLHNDR